MHHLEYALQRFYLNICCLTLMIGQFSFSSCQNYSSNNNDPVADTANSVQIRRAVNPEHYVNRDSLPKNYFSHPLKRPVSLSAAFAEIRPNHFHSGIDLRIGGVVGEPIYAPADGFVSRIKVSPYGGGKHIYIDHPNGYRTVYMHLNDYCGKIKEFVHDYQYTHQTFTFDVELPADSINIAKGTLIGHAGNTGGSGGPHLHYEIRFADNDQPINPLYFGMTYTDPIAPTIANIKLYPADQNTTINGSHAELFYKETRKKGKSYITLKNDSVSISGRFYTGIYTYDVSERSPGKNGVERIELYVDDTLFATYSNGSYLFCDTRSVNAHIDYTQYLKNKEYYILSRVLPGIQHPKSSAVRDSGYICFYDNALHKLEYKVYDYKGNCTAQKIAVRSLPPSNTVNIAASADSNLRLVRWDKPFRFANGEFAASIQAGTLYDNDWIRYAQSSRLGYIGHTHLFEPTVNNFPPHLAYNISIMAPESTSIPLDKMTIVSLKGKGCSAWTTKREGRLLTAEVKTFGIFTIAADTVAPVVKPLNFNNNGQAPSKEIRIKITDDLSGIFSYNCYLNGQWILAEYDAKVATLIINETSKLVKGRNSLRVVVSDAVANQTEVVYCIIRQ